MKDRIRQAREEAGYTVTALAKEIKVDKSSVSSFETGRRNPSPRTLSDIARVCRVNEEWLRTGEGPMRPEGNHYDVDSAMAEIASEIDLSQLEFNFAKAYLRLPVEERRFFERMVGSMIEDVQKMEKEENKRKKLHEEVDRQLDLEKSTQEESSDSMFG